jgi:hypothetical protein
MEPLTREEIRELNEQAGCAGEYLLFSNPSRASFLAAGQICDGCPVAVLCERHVAPASGYYTGTCAGKLFYEGVDVTELPDALPPPVLFPEDVSGTDVEYMLSEDGTDWSLWSESNQMAACWSGLLSKTVAKVAKKSKLSKSRVTRLSQEFNEAAEPDLKDFIRDLASAP